LFKSATSLSFDATSLRLLVCREIENEFMFLYAQPNILMHFNMLETYGFDKVGLILYSGLSG
jgi:hypothetical protein